MKIKHLYVLFFLSPPMPFFFAVPFFSLFHLFFTAFFQLFYYKQNCKQLVLLKVKTIVDHYFFHLLKSAFYPYFAFFSLLLRLLLALYFKTLNSGPWLPTIYSPLTLPECNYLLHSSNFL